MLSKVMREVGWTKQTAFDPTDKYQRFFAARKVFKKSGGNSMSISGSSRKVESADPITLANGPITGLYNPGETEMAL